MIKAPGRKAPRENTSMPEPVPWDIPDNELECPYCSGPITSDLPCGMLGWLCTKCGERICGGGQGPDDSEPRPRLRAKAPREATVTRASDHELVERVLMNLHRITIRGDHERVRALDSLVMDVFGLGSTAAAQLLEEFGYDPDEIVGIPALGEIDAAAEKAGGQTR